MGYWVGAAVGWSVQAGDLVGSRVGRVDGPVVGDRLGRTVGLLGERVGVLVTAVGACRSGTRRKRLVSS